MLQIYSHQYWVESGRVETVHPWLVEMIAIFEMYTHFELNAQTAQKYKSK